MSIYILAMLLSHRVMLLKFELYLCDVLYFLQFANIFCVGLLGSSCIILTKSGFISHDKSLETSSMWAGSISDNNIKSQNTNKIIFLTQELM